MLEKLIANPTVATIIAFLVVAITAFVKGTVRSGASCETEMKTVKELYEKQIADFRDRVQMANERVEVADRRADQWMEFAMRAAGAAKDIIEVTKSLSTRSNEGREGGR